MRWMNLEPVVQSKVSQKEKDKILYINACVWNLEGFPGGASGKESTWQCIKHRDVGSIPRLGRFSGEGNGNPF